jgi:putative CocE/NonD family hydrolase
VLIRTPYHRSLFELEVAPLVAAGYAVVVQSVRGRHGSEGAFVAFTGEGPDGYDTVEWVAAQPWCDGRVAMVGASYGAWVQWAAARERPPHLAALVSSACCASWTGEWPWRNGVLFPGAITWLHMVAGAEDNEVAVDDAPPVTPLRRLQDRYGQRLSQADEWLQHPSDDDYWAPLRLTASDFAAIDLPVLHVTGWFDGCQLGSQFLYGGMRRHSPARSRQSLLVGPWDHTVRAPRRSYDGRDFGPDAVLDYHAERIAWLDAQLSGSAPAATARVFDTGRRSWVTLPSFPTPGTTAAWHLVPGRALTTGAATAEPASYVHDPRDPVPSRPDGSLGAHLHLQRSTVHARDDMLVHASEPLTAPLSLRGGATLELLASTDAPDTDWFAELVDVAPDGTDLLVAHGLVRAAAQQPVVPGEVQRWAVPLTPRAHTFAAGHRLVLAVSSSAAPLYAPNPGHGGDQWTDDAWIVATNTVHGGTLSLPVGAE